MPLSPLDDRYASRLIELESVFSEFGLMRFRFQVEVEWLIFLADQGIAPSVESADIQALREKVKNFSSSEFEAIKSFEKQTNHDVKAVELFIQSLVPDRYHPFVHFGCTSEDINSTAYALMLHQGKSQILVLFKKIIAKISQQAKEWKAVPMLSRTHGQTATPTTVGKEFAVFASRWQKIFAKISTLSCFAKFSGATGNFAAHLIAFPKKDWKNFAKIFIEENLGLTCNPLTTQIEPHDYQADLLLTLGQASSIGIDFCRDVWGYISLGYFEQKLIEGEVGSSTMPHKVNPINFENAEGNFKLSRGIGQTLANELPISRWQRDLTDSTLQRSFGLPFGHFFLALNSLLRGLDKLSLNIEKLEKDLIQSPEVLTEAVQTVMRAEGMTDAYDQLKTFSRGRPLCLEKIREFIHTLDISDEAQERLLHLEPKDYIGLSVEIVDQELE